MNTNQIATAFEMLADEFERVLVETNQKGSEAFLRKDYATVPGLTEAARRLEEYQNKVAALEEEWNSDALFRGPETGKKWTKENPVTPAAFHAQCIGAVEKSLKMELKKQSRSSYLSTDGTTALICSISREHEHLSAPYYWFSFHPYQAEFLEKARKGFLVLGCGSSKNILVIPYTDFAPWSKRLNRTDRNDSWYSHIRITSDAGKFSLHLSGRGERVDVTKYRLK